MAQKKMLEEGTSVKGSVMLWPPQVEVSAFIWLDTTIVVSKAVTRNKRSIGGR